MKMPDFQRSRMLRVDVNNAYQKYRNTTRKERLELKAILERNQNASTADGSFKDLDWEDLQGFLMEIGELE